MEMNAMGAQEIGFSTRSNELLENFLPHLTIIAFEQGEFQEPDTAVVQRICAISKERGNC